MSRKIDKFRGEYYFLSNFYPAHVEYDGIVYKNNEAAFQAQKCARQEDKKQFANIDDPVIAKRLGAKVLLRRDWESVKLSIMKDIVKAKFVQNPELARKLLETKDAYIEEGNAWSDRFWGTYLGEGQNHKVSANEKGKSPDINAERTYWAKLLWKYAASFRKK